MRKKRNTDVRDWVNLNRQELIQMEPNKRYLSVPKDQRQQVKLLGAKFDTLLRMWWVVKSLENDVEQWWATPPLSDTAS